MGTATLVTCYQNTKRSKHHHGWLWHSVFFHQSGLTRSQPNLYNQLHLLSLQKMYLCKVFIFILYIMDSLLFVLNLLSHWTTLHTLYLLYHTYNYYNYEMAVQSFWCNKHYTVYYTPLSNPHSESNIHKTNQMVTKNY